jgi:hypothetical protein
MLDFDGVNICCYIYIYYVCELVCVLICDLWLYKLVCEL